MKILYEIVHWIAVLTGNKVLFHQRYVNCKKAHNDIKHP